MKTILITGIAGLLGSRFASWILDNTDYHVIGIDDLSGGYIENVDKRSTFYNVDLAIDQKVIYDIFNKHNIECQIEKPFDRGTQKIWKHQRAK